MTPKLSVKEDREHFQADGSMCVKVLKQKIWLAWGVLGSLQSRGHIGVSHEELCMAWYEVWI